MEFEDLQAIWDTQNEKPVFAMQDPRLLVALYQQRERFRRRVFGREFAPMYVLAVLMLAIIGALVATFRNIASLMRRFQGRFTHNGFGVSAWDYAGLAVAAAALLAIVVPLYLERKKHEKAQAIFAPSLREELDRGIAQLDFEMSLDRVPRVMRILTLLLIAAAALNWEAGRAAGNPAPWASVLLVFFLMVLGGGAGFASARRKRQRRLERRRALESMRAAFDEDSSTLTTTKIREDN